MPLRKNLYMRAFAFGTLFVIVIAGLSALPVISPVGTVLLPGMLLAALVFPTGIHSGHATAYMVLTAVFDVFLFSLIALFLLRRLHSPDL